MNQNTLKSLLKNSNFILDLKDAINYGVDVDFAKDSCDMSFNASESLEEVIKVLKKYLLKESIHIEEQDKETITKDNCNKSSDKKTLWNIYHAIIEESAPNNSTRLLKDYIKKLKD
jgi:hypothetical protein